jgi:hypothetical protein
MAAKLDTPEGRAVNKQRKAIIEPVFAQLFARFGRTLNYRGMVDIEIHLQAAVHNILKAIRARACRARRDAARTAAAARQSGLARGDRRAARVRFPRRPPCCEQNPGVMPTRLAEGWFPQSPLRLRVPVSSRG